MTAPATTSPLLYQPVLFKFFSFSALQTNAGGGCIGKPGPGCFNDSCAYFPENPVTGKGGMGLILTDKFALPTAKNPSQFGPVSRIVLSCTLPENFQELSGLAKGSTGLATMGRYNYSLYRLNQPGLLCPWIFALACPVSSNASGIALFNSAGPYNFLPKSTLLNCSLTVHTISGTRGFDTHTVYWDKSPDYYIGLTSFRALTDAFVKESDDALNLTLVKSVAAIQPLLMQQIRSRTRMGPAVPSIDLVLVTKKSSGESMIEFNGEDQQK
ncbi:UNVERIFIED_CONTAM: putative aspartic proteinase GIP2 [Sesamum radiatum]|uniref:Aspartic proteinase GIP2 n=1 Tax=Sesamum radiatum TaxID=300843 RepID=A0AAW2W7Q3_SESRA